MSELTQKKLEAWRKYAERRGVSTRTLDRWVEDGILPSRASTASRRRECGTAKRRGPRLQLQHVSLG